MNFDLNYLRTGKTEWAEIFGGYLRQKIISPKKKLLTGAGKAWAEGQKANLTFVREAQ